MSKTGAGLLWLLCAVDVAIGVWLAHVFIDAARTSGVAATVSAENAGYILLTGLMLIVPALCWYLRTRCSIAMRLAIAASPIVVFVALGGKLWVRWA